MKIAGKETKFMFIPYLVMYIDEKEYLYYFDDNKKLHIDFGPYAKLSPSKWNSLIGLEEHTIDEHYRVWTTIVELDERGGGGGGGGGRRAPKRGVTLM